jgi:transcriptional regulator with GAF, ATPase, and Fis domain
MQSPSLPFQMPRLVGGVIHFHVSAIILANPPLRERRDDILVLANFFHQKYAKLNKMRIMGFSADALEALWIINGPGTQPS